MQTSPRKSVEDWADWFGRVSRTVSARPTLELVLEREFLQSFDDGEALALLQAQLERVVYELDQDALDAELLASIVDLGDEAPAVLRLQRSLDRLSIAAVSLLLRFKDRRFELWV